MSDGAPFDIPNLWATNEPSSTAYHVVLKPDVTYKAVDENYK